jgi:hypothetical protein
MRTTAILRVGIIASIIWAACAAIYTHNADVGSAESFAKFAYKICSDSKVLAHDSDLSSCEREREEHLQTWMKGSVGNTADMDEGKRWQHCIHRVRTNPARLARRVYSSLHHPRTDHWVSGHRTLVTIGLA